MSTLFITATGTDIGKTFIAAGLIRALRDSGRKVEAVKPVISGFDVASLADSDTGRLLAALDRPIIECEVAALSPWRFAAPLSPNMAGLREGRTVDFDALLTWSRDSIMSRQGILLIEGVGGVMSPIDDDHTVLDWMAALRLPVLLAAGSYLGAISHTLTALDVLARRGLDIFSVVVSETAGGTVDLAETVSTLHRFAPTVDIVALPRLASSGAAHPSLQGLARRL